MLSEDGQFTEYSFNAKEGRLVELVPEAEFPQFEKENNKVFCQFKKTAFRSIPTVLNVGTIGLFLGNLAPFGEPNVLIGTKIYLVGSKNLKVVNSYEDRVTSKDTGREVY